MPHTGSVPIPSLLPGTRRPVTADEPTLLHEFFRRSARQWPDNVAIETPPSASQTTRRTITYAELDRLSDALAGTLREFVTRECIVAILLPRTSEHIYLAQLAILKAGGAYVCIDPTFPDAQVRHILDDAKPVAVLTNFDGLSRARGLDPDLGCALDVIGWAEEATGRIQSPTPAWLTPHALAYLIYTSGTTGRPKGVMIEHAGIVNLIRGDLTTFSVSPTDRVGQNSSCAYDSSVEEIWMALSAGATLIVMGDETTRLGPDLIPWLRDERITIFAPPPTLLRSTGCEDPERELPALRRVHVGGEPLPRDVADRWASGRSLLNDYGPTECSVTACRTAIRPGDPITIGRPVPGLRAWVLNEHLEEAPHGETGELCLGGAGLARGYRNDPEMTARKFPTHPRFGRIYRTGDLVHRDAAGQFYCHGRIDSQVKIRGYRIELEAIESRLATCPGVRAAACRVQGEGPQQQIVAFIVPTNPAHPPHADELKGALRAQLPEYMVPSHVGAISALPTTVSGKLNRRALPILDVANPPDITGPVVTPRDPIEEKVAAAVQQILGLKDRVSVEHDFFTDLGGDSLRAAGLISLLRNDPETAALAVRDVYDARTVAGLADRARIAGNQPVATVAGTPRRAKHPFFATLIQTAFLGLALLIGGPLSYMLAYDVVPDLTLSLGLAPFLFATPLLYFVGVGLYSAGAVVFAVLIKKLVIGHYRPVREPVWGSFYIRHWIVQQAVHLIPWRILEGTVFQHLVLRLLGAKIGKRVHIHRGVNLLHGGWDLLDIGDDVTLSREAFLRPVEYEGGQIVVGPITIGARGTLDVRAGLAPDTRMEPDAYLAAHAFLCPGATVPQGELWAGTPAGPVGDAPDPPPVTGGGRNLSPVWHGVIMLLTRLLLSASSGLMLAGVAVAFAWTKGIDAADAVEWLLHPSLTGEEFLLTAAVVTLVAPLTLISQCLSMRVLGRIPEGVISRWSLAYIRVWSKMNILDSAGNWLNGTLLWRAWLRGAGMKIGRNTELSTIYDTIPELVEIGGGTFFADGIYLAGPRLHRGTVTLARTTLGDGVFLGNYAVIPAGQQIPDGVLLGVCTVADDSVIRPGTSWFGRPVFELPKREVVEADPSLTHKPSWLRYVNRVFWELLRFTLPIGPLLLVLAWFEVLATAAPIVSSSVLVWAVVPALDFGLLAGLCVFGVVLKWLLLGRVRPATHPLWSCWCYRWDFNYTAWHFLVEAPISALEGTVWIQWYLRVLGVKIGRRVVLGGDVLAFTVDPDMLEVADGATVNAFFQAHTFEDRVLKIGRVKIGPDSTVGYAAVLLYGADIGEGTHVAANSVVMKHEQLQPHRAYAGCPTRLIS